MAVVGDVKAPFSPVELSFRVAFSFGAFVCITKTRPCNIQRFFHGCIKNDNFQLISFLFFHIFAQNINCWYTLEPQ